MSVELDDGRTITVPIAWYPRLFGMRARRSALRTILARVACIGSLSMRTFRSRACSPRRGGLDPPAPQGGMSFNTFGHVFRFTTWGESHGPALGAVVDGCPPGLALSEADLQPWLDKRRPGTSRFTTQRQEPDQVRILSGVFEGRTTGTPISLMIENVDQRSKDYAEVAQAYRPGHADYAYEREIWLARLSRRRAIVRARDGGAGRGGRRRPAGNP